MDIELGEELRIWYLVCLRARISLHLLSHDQELNLIDMELRKSRSDPVLRKTIFLKRPIGVVVITCPSHGQGLGFEPRIGLIFFASVRYD